MRLIQYGVVGDRLLHLCRAGFEYLEQISMATIEIVEHFTQLSRGCAGLEAKNPGDDIIGPCLVGRVEIPWFRGRFEGSHNDPR